MQLYRIATAAVNQTPLDWSGNSARILTALRELAAGNEDFSGRPDTVLFPEMSITGYGCEDAFHSPDLSRRAFVSLQNIAAEAEKILPQSVIVLGLPVRRDDRIFNCAAFVYQGRVRGIVPKRNLAGDGVHYEPRWFVADRETERRAYITPSGESVPFGPLLFEHRGAKISVEVCEDAWVARRPALLHVKRGVEIVLNPNASHFAFDKHRIRRNIALESSRSLGVAYVTVNLLGNEAGRMIYDGQSLFASGGEMLHEHPGLSFHEYILNEVALDLERNRALRSRVYSHLRQELAATGDTAGALERENPVVKLDEDERPMPFTGARVGFRTEDAETKAVPATLRPASNRPVPEYLRGHIKKETQFLRATTLGLFDYLRKSRSRGFVISLSGGADSATCALLVQRMLAYAVEELGARFCLERLGREELWVELGLNDDAADVTAQIAQRMLFTIYQGTDQSSTITREAAAAVAGALHSRHREVNVQTLMDGYRDIIEQDVIERKLTWEDDDLPLQNIQARVRSPMAWMLANTTNSLLITTSNRSEAAVGYSTMDGDTSGGLAPIAGVDKAFVQAFLRFMENTGDHLGTVPELSHINAQQPTAELRPLDQKQTDEGDLMPYALLDRIEKLAIRDRKPPLEVFKALRAQPDAEQLPEDDALRNYIRRFFQLWSRNQWKRERYAPAFHLDDENLDPRTWYRFPILSGGYADELREL